MFCMLFSLLGKYERPPLRLLRNNELMSRNSIMTYIGGQRPLAIPLLQHCNISLKVLYKNCMHRLGHLFCFIRQLFCKKYFCSTLICLVLDNDGAMPMKFYIMIYKYDFCDDIF